ncbi:uncharacterized protein LOC100888537 [Strongylocentrotus purpuratus]|uniref:Protein kinase domain-containing protein n=1 Tax=Strongylocentrotus purpuratus TaxID=7668 RepID=A0A7M7T5E8_STRPU|nr:uncharacterized protein LOC100888537 [Strongylocentrotus purpuratus]
MWSLGCILAELYLGKPLFWAKQKKDLLTQMTSLFGPLPTKVYQRAKFFTHFKESVGQPLSFMDNFSKFGTKLDCSDFKFVSFLQGMLTFDPSERMSVSEAIQHPFMAPEMAIKYVLPFKINGSEASGTYSPVDLTPSMYTHTPAGTLDSRNKHLTSLELLHQGTRVSGSTTKQKVIHVVAPFEPSKSKDTETPGVKVEPKSEQGDGGVEHSEGMIGGVRLPEAPRETIKKPSVGSIRVLKKQDASVMTKSSSSEHQHPQEPVLKKNVSKRSKQSLKIQKKPLKKPGDGGVEHGEGIIGGVRLPEALQEATKKPSVKSVRVLKKQDPPVTIHVLKKQDPPVTVHVLKKQDPPVTIGVLKKRDPPVTVHVLKKQDPPVTIGVLKKHDAPVMTKSSSSEHQHSQEPVFKEDRSKRSKQSLKIQQKPLISQPLAQVESDSKPCHAHGKEEHLTGVGMLIDSPKEDDPLTPDQTLKKTKGSTAKSKLNISEEETSGPDAKSEGTPGSPGESSHQFRYLKQQSVAAVSHKSKSLGVNMKKLCKSPVMLPEKSPASNSKRKWDRCKGTSESSSDVRKSDCSSDSKGMLICDEKKSVHPKKDVTLLVERVQKKKAPRATSKGKSEDPLKGHHQKSSTSSIGHKQLKGQERTSVYEFIVTPETKGKRSGSRKRSLQMAGDSVVKRSRRKHVASGSDLNAMKAHPVDNSLESSEKCLLEAWNSDLTSSEIKQSEARLSSSSKPSSVPTSLTSKMSVLSRLQAAGDNKTIEHSVPSPSVASSSSSSSSRPLSAKSSLQSFKRWSLESSPLQPDQPTKTVVRSERKRGAKAAHEHSPGTAKRKQKAKLLPSSPSSSESLLSPVGMPSLLQLSSPSSSSSSSRPLPSKRGTKPRLSPVKQSSPALQIRRLFTGASSSRTPPSPQQWRKASPNVQGQRKDIKATEAELHDQSDEEDEILLL